MAYASPMKIANGLVLDFTVDNADTAADTFLGLNANGEVTQFASVPRARVSGGGNLTEATSSVLTITGGTAAVLTSGLTIQVKQASGAQAGYLSSADWTTFNNKLGTSLTSAYVYVGNGSNVATGVAISGDITLSNTGNVQIVAGAIINADINASAAIAVSKLEALTASRVLGSDGSGVIQALNTATYPSLTELAYVKGVTSAIQTQLNNRLSVTLSSPTNGDVITYNGSAWVNSPSSTGVPTAGTTAQILRKIDNTNYNTEWHTLVAADITDVSSTAAELNKLSGVTTTATQFNFLNTLSGDVQAQLAAKLTTSLTQNYMLVGDASNIAVPLAPGTNGYVLTSVSGVPTWVSPGVGGTVTSVAASGGTTGMSFTGSPITTTGTLTLTGTLAIANGGTGLTALGTANQLIRVNAGATALEFFTPTYLTSVGTGVANELTYWSGTSTLGSLATATYPSLTELSYVKGLTSAAQTQLGTKISLSGTQNITGDLYLYDPTQTYNFRIGQGIGNNPAQILIAAKDYAFIGRQALQYLEFNAGNTTLNIGSDATGDTYYRNSSGYFTRLAAGTNGHVLTLAGGIPSWAAPSGGGTWGSITGTLSSQTDLQTALDDKFSLTNGGTLAGASVLLDGDGNTFTINNVDVFTLGATSSLDFDAPAFTFANGPVSFEAGTTSYSSLKIPHGVAPTSPVDGDFWSTTAGFFGRVNGATVGPFETGGGGLTVGTTTITSGTNTRVLYNNSGVLGEYTVSGSGNVAMTTSPVFTTPNIGTATGTASGNWFGTGTTTLTGAVDVVGSSSNTLKHTFNSIGTTQTDGAGLWFTNTTAAAAGAQQRSPSIVQEGQGWKTNATAASQSVKVMTDVLPVQGAANPTASYRWAYSVNGAAYTSFMSWAQVGDQLTVPSTLFYNGILILRSGSTSGTTIGNGTSGVPTNALTLAHTSTSTNTSGTHSMLLIGNTGSFAPTSGTAVFNGVMWDNTINQTGGANGQITGFNSIPTITAAVDVTGFDWNPTVTSVTGTHLSFRATSGNVLVPASSYHNYGTTSGSSGYGFRDNAGTMEVKNSGGSWTPFGDANIKQVKVTVSSAELLASFTTPKTLIAAPGAGSYIQIISCEMFLDYNSVAYVDGGAGGVTVDYVNSLSTLTGIFSISSTSDTMSFLDVAASQRALSNVENQPVILYSPTSNPTTGNSPLYVYLTYRIVTL